MEYLKITNPNGNIHYVPSTKKNLQYHTKANDLAPEGKKDRLELIDGITRTGDLVTPGELIKVISDGSTNPKEAKATISQAKAAIAEKDAALSEKDQQIADLMAKLAAAESEKTKAPDAAPAKSAPATGTAQTPKK
jgi:hypothetical protein